MSPVFSWINPSSVGIFGISHEGLNGSYQITENQSYRFSCTRCGECCRGDIVIRLNILDLQKMADFCGFSTTGELFEKGFVCEETLEGGGFRPVIKFKEYPARFCPFLENSLNEHGLLKGGCRLHPKWKPLVCSMAPLGRVWDNDSRTAEYFFTEPIQGCPGCGLGESQSVGATLGKFHSELEIESLYFGVLERFQRADAPVEKWRRFHNSLPVGENVVEYLRSWGAELT